MNVHNMQIMLNSINFIVDQMNCDLPNKFYMAAIVKASSLCKDMPYEKHYGMSKQRLAFKHVQ